MGRPASDAVDTDVAVTGGILRREIDAIHESRMIPVCCRGIRKSCPENRYGECVSVGDRQTVAAEIGDAGGFGKQRACHRRDRDTAQDRHKAARNKKSAFRPAPIISRNGSRTDESRIRLLPGLQMTAPDVQDYAQSQRTGAPMERIHQDFPMSAVCGLRSVSEK